MAGHTYLRTHDLSSEHLALDLEAAVAEIHAQVREPEDRRAVTLARHDGLNIVLVHLRAGAALDEHAAAGPVTVHVLDGHAQVTVGGESVDAPTGWLVALGAGVRHSVRTDEGATILLTVSQPQP